MQIEKLTSVEDFDKERSAHYDRLWTDLAGYAKNEYLSPLERGLAALITRTRNLDRPYADAIIYEALEMFPEPESRLSASAAAYCVVNQLRHLYSEMDFEPVPDRTESVVALIEKQKGK